jgi:lysophospholipid acyltransferase (LPLAT)-like uncharacterized protein
VRALPTAARPVVRAAGRLFALWLHSLRLRVQMPEGRAIRGEDYDAGSAIHAISERDLIAFAVMADGRQPIVLADEGNDGDWAVELASALRCEFVRGSSLHHARAAIRALIRVLDSSDRPAMLVVDGPVGPAGEAKTGIAAFAAWSGRSIVPVAAAAKWRIVFRRSWAAHYLPLPFSRVVVAFGEPLAVRHGASRAELDAVARTITIRLRELRARAEHGLEPRPMAAESKLA